MNFKEQKKKLIADSMTITTTQINTEKHIRRKRQIERKNIERHGSGDTGLWQPETTKRRCGVVG